MSVHSITKIWIHFILGTKNRNKSLANKEFRKRISKHLSVNSEKSKNLYESKLCKFRSYSFSN
jgi:hypothetical protein